ncbi:MAG: NAD(+) synthase [Bacteroidetes bacterium]|nr:MAG: NAD(+) synthase [Bacteroidota bacterium]
MKLQETAEHIQNWLSSYCQNANMDGFVVGISGGIDSALTSTLCARTGKKVIVVNMPIRQTSAEYQRAQEHIADLEAKYSNVSGLEIDLTPTFTQIERDLPDNVVESHLAMANTRARLRMTTLYAVGQANKLLVAGTGNKIEDFGIGFFTKYGDGGVDLSPIADLTKTEVKAIAQELGVVDSILAAKPTDGLWADGRSDEDQIGATYPELEWAMDFIGDEATLSERQKEVLSIYRRLNKINQHKMVPIPVCVIPSELKN